MTHENVLDAIRVLNKSHDYHERWAALKVLAAEQVRRNPAEVRAQCRSCHHPRHPESKRRLCARHEREHALDIMQLTPFDMQLQQELYEWTTRAMAAGQFSFDDHDDTSAERY